MIMIETASGSSRLSAAKRIVCNFRDARAIPETTRNLEPFIAPGFTWKAVRPFDAPVDLDGSLETFWSPLAAAFTGLHLRDDVFLAGHNDADGGETVWIAVMGHAMGLFDRDWLGIPAHGRIAHLRFVEFFRVEGGQIAESTLFCDLIGLMHQAGVYPLPPMTGTHFMYPGPRTHDGLLFDEQDGEATRQTLDLVNVMIADLRGINALEKFRCPPELLRKTWHEDMIWYGPCGIGASYTLTRYQEQHQYPFRLNLADKSYRGHVARIAEGHYCAFFGWPSLMNRNTGGFLGLPAAREPSEMRIVDVYRRAGDRLAENWVFIDLPHYLAQQGLDVFERLRELRRLES